MILKIIIASTRPGRKGPIIASWIYEAAKNHGGFEVELIDLAEVNLPFLDEPHHPRLKKYEHEHTKAWSNIIDKADAYIFVTPEYNYGFPGTLKNALDFLFEEWGYKPAGIVSYGGLSAGTRATQMLKQVLQALKMVATPTSVNIPFFPKFITAEEKFMPDEMLELSAKGMFAEIEKWGQALAPMRGK
jgi:NAD(P)H-dependent FMN reductase